MIKNKPPLPKEKEIVSEILLFLESRGVFVWKNATVGIYDPTRKVFRRPVSRFQIKGVSDIIGIYGGKFLAIEVKRKNGIVSQEQREFMLKVKDKGGIAFLARSVTDVKAELGL